MNQGQPTRIVVVEDNPGDVFLLSHALDLQGSRYRLDVLEDGEKALQFVRRCSAHGQDLLPSVFVLDMHLPRQNGLVVLRAIRENPALSAVRVIALSGVISTGEEAEALKLGVRLYRKKPLEPAGLRKLGEEIVAICREYVPAVVPV